MTVQTGIDRIASGDAALPRSARIALLTNRAAQTSNGDWTLDTLRTAGYNVTLLLGPEHGVDTTASAGAAVAHGMLGDLPILSLYGADQGPVEAAISGIDHIVADLPDVGVRYYTYPWTVRETMRLAARFTIPMTVLDRPNPLDGVTIEGNLPEFDSPVCSAPVTTRHGLTLGELSLWNSYSHDIDVSLDVVCASGWSRDMSFAHTGLPWLPPSPALTDPQAVDLYAGTCLLEGTTISEGRGTDAPFRQFGSPSLDAAAVIESLRGSQALDGTQLERVSFTPRSSKWEGQECEGIRLTVTDEESLRPLAAGLTIIGALRDTPDFQFLPSFDRLAGTHDWREALTNDADPADIIRDFADDEEIFRRDRERVLLY